MFMTMKIAGAAVFVLMLGLAVWDWPEIRRLYRIRKL